MSRRFTGEIEIRLPQTFSVEEVADFRANVNQQMEEGHKRFVFDFGGCDFVDSTGLGVIVAIYKKCAEAGGSIRLKSLKPQVMKLFQLTRLDKVFEIL